MSIVRKDDLTGNAAADMHPVGWLNVTIVPFGASGIPQEALQVDFTGWQQFRQYVEKSDPAFGGKAMLNASTVATGV